MANDFYNRGASFNPDELADGDAIEAEFDSVCRGFDTIEELVNANKAGYPTQTFHVATATEGTHAVPKAQMDTALGFKLDAANYNAADVLNKLKTVDGSSSGLDADLLDGQEGAYYRNASNINAGTLAKERLPTSIDASITGNAATASKLLSAITLSLSGGASGSVLIDGSTNVTLNVTISSDSAEVGKVAAFSRTSAPNGYLKCNGAAISRTTYAALFSVIGTTYGAGDGSTTFNVPDLRGEFIRGWDDARGVDSGRVLGSWQDGQNSWHGHGITINGYSHSHWWGATTSTNGNHQHGTGMYSAAVGNGSSLDPGEVKGNGGGGGYATSWNGNHTHDVSGWTSTDSHGHSASIDGSGGNEVRVRNKALLYCIKY